MLTVNGTTDSGAGYRALNIYQSASTGQSRGFMMGVAWLARSFSTLLPVYWLPLFLNTASSVDLDMQVSGVFDLKPGDRVALHIRCPSDGAYNLRSYSNFAGIDMTRSTRGFGANWNSQSVNFRVGALTRPWTVDGALNFISSTSDFDAANGQLKAAENSLYLIGLNLNFKSGVCWEDRGFKAEAVSIRDNCFYPHFRLLQVYMYYAYPAPNGNTAANVGSGK